MTKPKPPVAAAPAPVKAAPPQAVKKPRRPKATKGVPGFQPSADELAEVRERQRKAVELALAGLDYDKIAQQLGYADRSGAWRAVRTALDRVEQPKVKEYRDLENARLDRLQAAYWAKAIGGDLAAATYVLRLFERRAKLNGLDQPQAFVGAFEASSIPRDPAERAARLVVLRDRLAEQVADASG